LTSENDGGGRDREGGRDRDDGGGCHVAVRMPKEARSEREDHSRIVLLGEERRVARTWRHGSDATWQCACLKKLKAREKVYSRLYSWVLEVRRRVVGRRLVVVGSAARRRVVERRLVVVRSLVPLVVVRRLVVVVARYVAVGRRRRVARVVGAVFRGSSSRGSKRRVHR